MGFAKMHGLGNDFVLIDARDLALPDLPELARYLCHRRFGIGADQMLLLYKSEVADFRMRIFNADGSEVEMCGNGIRCFAKYVWDKGLSGKDVLDIETFAGIIRPERVNGLVKVDMGEPVLEPEMIPVKISQQSAVSSQQSEKNELDPLSVTHNSSSIIDYPLQIDDNEFRITCVSMGNPHAVIVVDNVATFPVTYYGPMIENHHIFPNRANVEFIEVLNSGEIKMRVWERGSGETMACGTGASAAAVASRLKGLTGKRTTVHLAGGDLLIEFGDDNHVYMTGPAEEVFSGDIKLKGEGVR
ncbi:MAG: diaminopimelate epimerase [Nitrospirota bacterium]